MNNTKTISLNGLDGCGKTTQFKILQSLPDSSSFKYGKFEIPDNINELDPSGFHRWWFSESSNDEFCDIMYESICRMYEIYGDNTIYDKGIATFDARIWATLVIKGLSKAAAYDMIRQKKLIYKIDCPENIRILLKNAGNTNEKTEDVKYKESERKLYYEYRSLQAEFLNWLEQSGYFTHIISTDCSIDETTKEIIESIDWVEEPYVGRNNLIEITKLKLPKYESNLLQNVFEIVKRTYGDSLSAFLVGGSVSRGKYIPGWSDIDILLVVNVYKQDIFDELMEIINTEIVGVKVGITIISINELERQLFDAKSAYLLYAYNSNKINSLIFGEVSKKCAVSLEGLKEKNYAVIPESLHKLKRELSCKTQPRRGKDIYKLVYLISKVCLINQYNVFPDSYEAVMRMMDYMINLKAIQVDKIIKDGDYSDLEDYSYQLIDYVSNNIALKGGRISGR